MRRNILNKQDFETIQEMKEKYQILNEEKVRLEEMNDYLKKEKNSMIERQNINLKMADMSKSLEIR